MTLTFGSLFAGIGGFDLGFTRSGMAGKWQVEIDGQCNTVLAHHWPNIERLEDVQDVGKRNLESVDLICGGFPCQDLSVAGKREGLSGERSGLWFEFHRILEELRPRWVVVENVPGLLSSNGGRDFAIVLRGLAELRYGVCWRVLDAQYFGVAQRRRRVFLVGSLGDGRSAEVLFESEGSAWDSAPSRETGEGIVERAISRPITSSQQRIDAETETFCVTPWDHESKRIHNSGGPAPTIAGSDGSGGQRMPYTIVWDNGQGDPNAEKGDTAYCVNPQMNQGVATVGALQARDYKDVGNQYVNEGKVIAFQQNCRDEVRMIGGDGSHVGAISAQCGMKQQNYVAFEIHGGSKRKDRPDGGFYVREEETTKPLDTGGLNPNCAQGGQIMVSPTIGADISRQAGGHPGIEEYTDAVMRSGFGVRRLTPTECERLQGFPDAWTDVDGMSDSARYRMLGNAVAVPCAEWLGRRISEVDTVG